MSWPRRGPTSTMRRPTRKWRPPRSANYALGGACPSGYGDPAGCPFATHFEAIVGRLGDSLAGDPGDEQLFVTTYYNRAKGTPNEPIAHARRIGADRTIDCTGRGQEVGLHDAISCRGAAHGAIVVDAYRPFYASPVNPISPDGVHPNDTGHALLAAALRAKRGTARPTRPFTIDRLLRRRDGSAVFSLHAPAPGVVSLRASAPGIASAARGRRAVRRPGTVSVKLSPTARARAALARRGRLKTSVTIAYAPEDASE